MTIPPPPHHGQPPPLLIGGGEVTIWVLPLVWHCVVFGAGGHALGCGRGDRRDAIAAHTPAAAKAV